MLPKFQVGNFAQPRPQGEHIIGAALLGVIADSDLCDSITQFGAGAQN
jgi:hypothetical protein